MLLSSPDLLGPLLVRFPVLQSKLLHIVLMCVSTECHHVFSNQSFRYCVLGVDFKNLGYHQLMMIDQPPLVG